ENEPVISGTVTTQASQPLTNWTVFLDTNNNDVLDDDEVSTTTNANGFYGFFSSQVPSDTPVYVDLVNLDPTSYSFCTPSDGSTLVTYSGDLITADFSITQVSSIEGTVFLDSNQSGDAAGQTGLSGWTVFIDSNANNQLDAGEQSTLTNSSGAYTLFGLAS